MEKLLRYLLAIHLVPREIGFWQTIHLEGVDKFTRVLRLFGVSPKWPIASIHVRGLAHKVFVRLGSSDYYALKQIFAYRDYQPAEQLDSVDWVADAGANAGFFSLLMLNRYPSAHVIALEPEPGNFKICTANLEPYGDRAKVICAGLWSHPTQLAISGVGWSAEVREVSTRDASNVDAVDVPFLLGMTAGNFLDLLKVDIERSELRVFADPGEWLPAVRNIVIELHGADCEQAFFDALSPFDYKLAHSGDATICTGLTAKSPTMAHSRVAIQR